MSINHHPLELRSIYELKGCNFFVPPYQRGYRWDKQQVKDLLEDIYEFFKASDKDEFYCLQPIVVKERGDDVWEVIDGQQRLTTIYIILMFFNSRLASEFRETLFHINYETRPDSAVFLQNISAEDSTKDRHKNIDYHHIYSAYQTIKAWFSDKKNLINDIESTLQNRVKIIWYEVDSNGADVINIFTRLNMGKIPLTSAELIKALFLRSKNFGDEDEEAVNLQQLQLATEWDNMEYGLRNPAFWYFVSDDKRAYPTRIEYLFELKVGRPKSDYERYHTFYEFQKLMDSDALRQSLWLEVKKDFSTLNEWYEDHYLYHMVGLLIAMGEPVQDLLISSREKSKSEFRQYLDKKIRGWFKKDLNELDYETDKDQIKKVLLLFNIKSIVDNEKSNYRFPFDRFKADKWDIEHIRSQGGDNIRRLDKRPWLEEVARYLKNWIIPLSSKLIEEASTSNTNIQGDEAKDIVSAIECLLQERTIDEQLFGPLHQRISKFFGEESLPEDINNVCNLTLLDSGTNRGYKNAPFSIKRQTIIERDFTGTFVPLCTKNVFLKYYSKNIFSYDKWTLEDSKAYEEAIRQSLINYLPEIPNSKI